MSGEPIEQAQQTTVRVMPLLGLAGLARELWPGDADDKAKMDQHVADLFALNSDVLRTDTSFMIGQMVKVPANG